MSITVCSEGSDRAFDEMQSWPVGMAMAYVTLAYVTRRPVFTIFFGYMWESFELLVLVLNQQLLRDKNSKFAQWAIETGPLSWVVPPSSDGKARPCVESPLTSLLFDPVIFIGAVLLWSVGVERLVGARYDEERAYGMCARRCLYYVAVFFTTVFASRVLFRRYGEDIGDEHKTDGFEPDIGLLMAALVYITFMSFIPIRSGQRNGYTSTEARRAYLAYIVYVLFMLFISVVGILGGPFLNVRSSWIRAVLCLGVLWLATLLVGAVRLGRWCNAAAGECLDADEKRYDDFFPPPRRKVPPKPQT